MLKMSPPLPSVLTPHECRSERAADPGSATPISKHDPRSLGAAWRDRVPCLVTSAAILTVILAALPTVVPSPMSPGPAWVGGFHAPWFLSATGCLVLVSFAVGFSQPPLVPQALFHLGLVVSLLGSAASTIQSERGILTLEPGKTVRRYESSSGPRLLPFGVLWHTPLPSPASQASIPSLHPKPKVGRPTKRSPFPGQLLVQWPARALSVRLPVRVGDTPLLAPPGETPTPSNAFRIVFLRLVPDFVMDPVTREVTARSESPANPALFVREIGPGYTLERWVFARFPELAMHQEAEHTSMISPLRLRYEVDAMEEPMPPDRLALAPESEPSPSRASGGDGDSAAAALEAWALSGPRIPGPGTESLTIVHQGRPHQTLRPGDRHPVSVEGYILKPLGRDSHRPGAAALEVSRPVGAGWVITGAGLALAASLVPREPTRRRLPSCPT